MSDLEERIGHNFQDKQLLKSALTHSSSGSAYNYERLEFLGDRVLGLAIAETLYKKFPDEPEGDLAKRLAALVQGSFLAVIAGEIRLGEHIIFSEAERSAGGANNENILADVFESLIGALYLEKGYEFCRDLIVRLWGERIYSLARPPLHPKTSLQEWAQGQALPLPVYELSRQEGPDHAPVFEITVHVEGHKPVSAKGRSRREAEKMAAQAFMAGKNISS